MEFTITKQLFKTGQLSNLLKTVRLCENFIDNILKIIESYGNSATEREFFLISYGNLGVYSSWATKRNVFFIFYRKVGGFTITKQFIGNWSTEQAFFLYFIENLVFIENWATKTTICLIKMYRKLEVLR